MPANVLQRWTSEKLTHNIWGIFRFARTYVTCSQQQIKSKQCHNRHKIQRANRGKHRFIEAQRLLRHTQNYQPRNCVRGEFFVFISFLRVTSCILNVVGKGRWKDREVGKFEVGKNFQLHFPPFSVYGWKCPKKKWPILGQNTRSRLWATETLEYHRLL